MPELADHNRNHWDGEAPFASCAMHSSRLTFLRQGSLLGSLTGSPPASVAERPAQPAYQPRQQEAKHEE